MELSRIKTRATEVEMCAFICSQKIIEIKFTKFSWQISDTPIISIAQTNVINLTETSVTQIVDTLC